MVTDCLTASFVPLQRVGKSREPAIADRDLVYENSMLLVQYRLMYRDLSESKEVANTGTAMKQLKLFTVMFDGGCGI